ncbi:MAG TPA: type III-A CRISPR-associated RAMP protein Csm4 [bacterium]|nr:type III-A CRISPR-associated RAMP protein Csm4 [bacterium]HQI47890.1 type III-A CRISPR-associated RAMP protein Csm4 [bacterium]HQJ66208.1 type III-A CRISPR-associated RAMP protein Csm4 [bacterium]
MSDHVVKLTFTSPLRIGTEEIGLEGVSSSLHSDSLFAAVCHAFANLYGRAWLNEKLAEFQQGAAFILSSAFPYRTDRYYLPRPYSAAPFCDKANGGETAKAMKRLRYLDYRHLADWLYGRDCPMESILQENAELEMAMRGYLTPRVALDRLDSSSAFFLCGQMTFEKGAGLYFLLRVLNPAWLPPLHNAFDYLAEEGLGSERSCGLGRFSTEWHEPDNIWRNLLEANGSRFYLAGLFHPLRISGDWSEAFYTLIERRGWFLSAPTGRQMKRKTVWMVQEGGIFPFAPEGHLVDVAPDTWMDENKHPVWRNGIPFTIRF